MRGDRCLPDLPNEPGMMKRSASLITMQSAIGFAKLINSNGSNNFELKDSGDEKGANQRESFHEEGEIQLQVSFH